MAGINLGKHINDIYEGITVAGIACQPFKESYVPTEKVVCVVDSPGINEPKEGPIVVKVGTKSSSGKGRLLLNEVIRVLIC